MQLHDATDRAAVDLFLRSLEFSFGTTSIVGIPGGIVGLSEERDDGDTAVLLHELEHVRTLTYPLGPILTGIGLRASDLRKEAVKQFNSWERFVATHDLESEDARKMAAEALSSIRRVVQFAKYVQFTTQLMAPLLEGLALLAEFEIEASDASRAWDLLVSIEYLHSKHALLIRNPSNAALFESEEREAKIKEGLYFALARQLETSRLLRRILLKDRLFFRDELDPSPQTATPYFVGYLYLRQLEESWRKQLPDLRFGDFYHIATRAICEILPLSLMNLYTLDPERFVTDDFPTVYYHALEMLRSLSTEHIRRIQENPKLLALRPKDDDAEVYEYQRDDLDAEVLIRKMIQISVFDIEDINSKDAEVTDELLQIMERAKFLTPTSSNEVWISFVNEETRTVYLVDQASVGSVEVHDAASRDATYFVFKDYDDFNRFLRIADSEGRLGRIEGTGETMSVHPPKQPVRAYLKTYLYFWPLGIPSKSERLPNTTIARVLVVREGQDLHSFESCEYSVEDLSLYLDIRERARHLRESIASAVGSGFGDYRRVLYDIRSVHPELGKIVDPIVEGAGHNWSDVANQRCAGVYTALLFPALAGSAPIPKEKFALLREHLGRAAYLKLRKWLLNGALIHPSRAYFVEADQIEQTRRDVEGIRTICKHVLGSSLIAFRQEPPSVILSLLS